MIKELNAMTEIHKIREKFYQMTKDKSHNEIVRLIKVESKKVERELAKIKPVPGLIIKKKYIIPEPEAMKEIHQIREGSAKYNKD